MADIEYSFDAILKRDAQTPFRLSPPISQAELDRHELLGTVVRIRAAVPPLFEPCSCGDWWKEREIHDHESGCEQPLLEEVMLAIDRAAARDNG